MSHVLLVDDDSNICSAMTIVLQGKGYEVSTAHNGDEALSILNDINVNFVLLDIFMPEKDGFETIGEIRTKHSDVKIIAMSGYNEHQYDPLAHARTLGADEALAKPFSPDELVATLQSLEGND